MEVYAPIPDELLHRASRSVRVAGTIVLVVALFVVLAAVARFTFDRRVQPNFHNYGIVHTSLGIAAVACGGEASNGCGVDTAIRFASCSPQYGDYFGHASDPVEVDRLACALLGKRPPSGSRWFASCGWAGGMIKDHPLARLDSN